MILTSTRFRPGRQDFRVSHPADPQDPLPGAKDFGEALDVRPSAERSTELTPRARSKPSVEVLSRAVEVSVDDGGDHGFAWCPMPLQVSIRGPVRPGQASSLVRLCNRPLDRHWLMGA